MSDYYDESTALDALEAAGVRVAKGIIYLPKEEYPGRVLAAARYLVWEWDYAIDEYLA